MIDYAEAHISTEQQASCEDARLQSKDGDQGRETGLEETPREGTQAPDAVALLNPARGLPRDARLRNSAEFRLVYETGRRFDGRLMSVFVRPNGLKRHRLGITASRKLARRAVDRNRLKRLLREAFRLSSATMEVLPDSYDWVLNPRRSMLKLKLAEPLREFQEIIERVKIQAGKASPKAGLHKP
jgi:ribonuclease P protein component